MVSLLLLLVVVLVVVTVNTRSIASYHCRVTLEVTDGGGCRSTEDACRLNVVFSNTVMFKSFKLVG